MILQSLMGCDLQIGKHQFKEIILIKKNPRTTQCWRQNSNTSFSRLKSCTSTTKNMKTLGLLWGMNNVFMSLQEISVEAAYREVKKELPPFTQNSSWLPGRVTAFCLKWECRLGQAVHFEDVFTTALLKQFYKTHRCHQNCDPCTGVISQLIRVMRILIKGGRIVWCT